MAEQISETYNIDHLRMDETRWKALERVYTQLPEFVGYSEAIPFWFGLEPDDADAERNTSAQYLWASVEPSGLLVVGYLSSANWEKWQEAFVFLASSTLGFTVKSAEEDAE